MTTQAPEANPLEARLAKLEGSFEQLDKRLTNIESEIRMLRGEQRQQFFWLLGIVIVGAVLPVVIQLVTR